MSLNKILLRLCFAAFLLNSSFMNAQKLDNASTLTMNTKLLQPPYLKAGDTVAIVAPSGILINRKDEVEHAKTLLKRWGLHAI